MVQTRRMTRTLFASALSLGLWVATLPASAHPHVYIVVKAEVLFDASGKISGLRQAWTFDEMYSAYQVQGLAKDGKRATREDLAPLAKEQTEQLADSGFFTVAKDGGKQVEFDKPIDVALEEGDDKLVTLSFVLPLKTPATASKAFTLQVYDPSYFVSFEFDDKTGFAIKDAPKNCISSVTKPPPLVAGDSQKLSESFFSGLSPGANFGIKMASRASVACP